MRHLIVLGMLLASTVAAFAVPQNPQRIVGGGVAPVYVNATSTNQSIAHYAYINQTQYVANAKVCTLSTTGAGPC